MDSNLNILKLELDRSHRIKNSSNLSLNQCSNNNRIVLYYDYDGVYDYIFVSFRKPDGWLSDKVKLIKSTDENGVHYMYYDIPEEFTSFVMGGRSAILVINLYMTYSVGPEDEKIQYTATAGNIRINVNYVDDALISTRYSEAYITGLNAQIGALEEGLARINDGDILVGKAQADRDGNVFGVYYETKSDADIKYKTLNEKKIDRDEIEDQSSRLSTLETEVSTSNLKVNSLEASINTNANTIVTNTADIETLKNTKVSDEEFRKTVDELLETNNSLQSQIDDIASASNVKDMVGSYSDLTKYDKTKLEIGDRIQVLSDAFYGNVPTIYRWDGSEFIFVGKYASASYTKAEIDSQHNSIKNSIANKATLIDGKLVISKGNNPISTTDVNLKTVNGESIWGEGNIQTPIDSEFSLESSNPVENRIITEALINKADSSKISLLEQKIDEKADITSLNSKQDKLNAGPNVTITEVNGELTISVDAAIKLRKVDELPDVGLSNIIYLYKPDNEDTYSEYLWVEDEQRFEPFGEAGIHLDNYYTKLQTDTLLADKATVEALKALDSRIAAMQGVIANKAEKETTEIRLGELDSSLKNLNSAVSTKADKTELTSAVANLASKYDVPEAYQTKLVNQQNIKSINGTSLLGEGDLVLADKVITDLGLYLRRDDAQTFFDDRFNQKANKSDLKNIPYSDIKGTPDLTEYRTVEGSYSKEEVVGLIEAADISGKLNDYYDKEEVDSLIKNVKVDLTGYATEGYVKEKVAEVDLRGELERYATQVWVGQQGYLRTTDAAITFATKAELPTVPTNISSFTNDANYLVTETLPKNISFFNNDKGYLIASDIRGKQDNLVSGTNIKTINGQSILGSGNLQLVTDISHLETKSDAQSKLTSAKDYTDRTNATTLASAKTYTNEKIAELTEDTEGILDAIGEIKDQIGGEGVNILSSINQNKADINTLRTDLTFEINTRTSDISNLTSKITSLTDSTSSSVSRIDADLISLNNKLTAEISERKTEDGDVKTILDNISSELDTKISYVETSISNNQTSLSDLQKTVNDNKTAADTRILTAETNINKKVLFKNWVV